MKINKQTSRFITRLIRAKITPALMGEAGIGKSAIVRQTSIDLPAKLFTVAVNELGDRGDLSAPRLVPTTSGGFAQAFYPHITITEAIEYAKAHPDEMVLVYLDEYNRAADAGITSAAMTLTTNRAIGGNDIPDNVSFMLSGNTEGNVISLDTAAITRLAMINVSPDAETVIDALAAQDKLHPYVALAIRKAPENLVAYSITASAGENSNDPDDPNSVALSFEGLGGEDMVQITVPRTIEHVSLWLLGEDINDLRGYLSLPSTLKDRDGTTLLTEQLETLIGNTAFRIALEEVIIEEVNKAVTQTATATGTPTVVRPMILDMISAAKTIDEQTDLVTQADETSRSALLLYLVTSSTDYTSLISLVGPLVDNLVKSDITLLTQVACNQDNLAALQATASPAHARYSSLFN